jgi:hypothetical protein
MSLCLPSTARKAVIRRALAVMAIALCTLGGPTGARAQTVAVGEGVALAYESGSLDPVTLAGSAEGVTVTVDGQPVATIARLALATRGALADADFTITSLEAHGIAASDGTIRLAEASGRDLPLGSLRALVREMEAQEAADFTATTDRLGQIDLGTLTLTGLEGEDARAHVKIARISAEGGGEGRLAAIEVEDSALIDKEEGVHVRLKSARVAGLSFKARTADALEMDGLSITGNTLDVAASAMRYTAEMRQLDGGVPYSARSTLTITDLTVKPGLAPDPQLAAFFADLGDAGVRLQVEGRSTGEPQDANLDMSSTLEVTAQTGDALAFSSRAQIPIAVWQLLDEALAKDPAKADPEGMLQMMASIVLVDAEIAVTAGAVADRLLEAAARDSELDPAAMRAMMAEEADGVLGALPRGGAELRDAIMAFIARSGTLRLAIRPTDPIPLSALMTADEQIDALWDKLNVTVTHKER